MSRVKVSKISISLPMDLLSAVDGTLGGKTRSRYFQEVAEGHLRAAGKYFPDPVAAELARTRELIAAKGIEAVRAKLAELTEATIEAEPALAGGGR